MGKRLFDLSVAFLVLLLSLPVMLGAAVAIRLAMGAPVIFRQVRPGLHGEPFTLLKFRTMSGERDGTGALLLDSERLTSVGAWIRKLSIDELPQLVNVLRGDMSLVGPRPLLMEYLPLYSADQARRHEVRPGITGWAQVMGRNALDWEERFRLDVWYVDNRSSWLDLRILSLTVLRVLQRRGINEPGATTMTPFAGNRPRSNHG